MRVLVCGDRNYSDKELVYQVLDGLYSYWNISDKDGRPFTLIEGGAKGADSFAAEWFLDLCEFECIYHEHLRFPANWGEYGKAAGPMRNFEMLNVGKPDIVIGFHDNIKQSKGTRHMLDIAKGRGIKTILISQWN